MIPWSTTSVDSSAIQSVPRRRPPLPALERVAEETDVEPPVFVHLIEQRGGHMTHHIIAVATTPGRYFILRPIFVQVYGVLLL